MPAIFTKFTKSILPIVFIASNFSLQAEGQKASFIANQRKNIVQHFKHNFGTKEKAFAKLLQNAPQLAGLSLDDGGNLVAAVSLLHSLTGETDVNDSKKEFSLKLLKQLVFVAAPSFAYAFKNKNTKAKWQRKGLESVAAYVVLKLLLDNELGFYVNFSDFKPDLKPDFSKLNPQDPELKKFLKYVRNTVKYSFRSKQATLCKIISSAPLLAISLLFALKGETSQAKKAGFAFSASLIAKMLAFEFERGDSRKELFAKLILQSLSCFPGIMLLKKAERMGAALVASLWLLTNFGRAYHGCLIHNEQVAKDNALADECCSETEGDESDEDLSDDGEEEEASVALPA